MNKILNSERFYNWLTITGFILLFAGLPISKFLVSVGILTLTASSLFLIFHGKMYWNHAVARPYYFLVGTFLVLTLSLLYSSNLTTGFSEILVQNGLITIPLFTIIHWDLFREKITLFLGSLLISAVMASFVILIFYACPVSIAQNVVSNVPFFQEYPDVINKTQFGLYSPFIDRLHFAYILCFSFLIALYFSFKRNSPTYKLVVLFLGGTILVLGARGAQIALLFALIPYLLLLMNKFFPQRTLFSSKSLAGVLIFLIAFSLLSYQFIPSIKNRYGQMMWEIELIRNDTYENFDYKHFTTLTRLKSIENSWALVKKNAFLGVGIGDVKTEMASIYDLKGLDIPIHNQNYYLYLWLSGGIMALTCFLLFMGIWIRHQMVSNTDWTLRSLTIGYWVFVLLILLIDVVLKYHIGVFSVPLFMMSISALGNK